MHLNTYVISQQPTSPPVSGLHGRGIYLAAAQGRCPSITNLHVSALRLSVFIITYHQLKWTIIFSSFTCLSWLNLCQVSLWINKDTQFVMTGFFRLLLTPHFLTYYRGLDQWKHTCCQLHPTTCSAHKIPHFNHITIHQECTAEPAKMPKIKRVNRKMMNEFHQQL